MVSNNYIVFLFQLALILSLMINMIDFEAKKALHVIHGFAILNKDKHINFQVFINCLFINSFLIKLD